MSKVMENVKTLNSVVRTIMLAGVTGCVGFAGWLGYHNYVVPASEGKKAIVELADLQEKYSVTAADNQRLANVNEQLGVENDELVETNDRLDTAMKLLKIDRRVANLTVLKKGTDDDGNPFLKVSFTEMDPEGNPVGAAKEFTLPGKMFFIDCWVAKFEDEYVEQADELRSATMFAFKSIFGDAQNPKDAFPLDSDSQSVPGIYQDSRKSKFESQIWSDFWNVCNDLEKQQELGIRAIHGQANYLPSEEGRTYEVTIRSSGAVSLTPLAKDEP